MSQAAPDPRLTQLTAWLTSIAPGFAIDTASLAPASADASFRRYFRVRSTSASHASLIVMDAPPDKEDCAPFIRVADYLGTAGVSVPRVLCANTAEGFLLLTDLGSRTYLAELAGNRASELYGDAMTALVRIQGLEDQPWLPRYDAQRLGTEMDLFDHWYVTRHLGHTLDAAQSESLARIKQLLIKRNLGEAQVTVHRDYHSRNLMLLESGNPGILDFQDAVRGPISYDLVSLLRDAYIEWDEERVLDWAIRYWDKARAAQLGVPSDFAQFWHDFEWMGLQRHLKVLGIFARLYHRDGKAAYLADLPRVARYARGVAARYDALRPLMRLLDQLEGRATTVAYTF